ncbi:hypothetical protein [Marinilactibacillus sp. Marseille-P9653]|uniref:hypothetical protein n=1 Tax=Marinilactibacillus sp. Marseille-P9653 TaxID=2866583 RepID=UPI001CE3C20A|nr:hypothetical protein [Marinilactibacillus sp. Marseille-P9653]
MKKSNSALLALIFTALASMMLIALLKDILPTYADHGRSMVVGTLAYITMGGIVILSSFKNEQLGEAGLITTLGFVLTHILIEARLFSSIGVSGVTNPFGYAAIGAFLLAGAAYVVSKVRFLSQLTLYVNGLMVGGTTLVYYHVASLAPIRGSILFFVPFTLFCLWTVTQYGLQVSRAFKTRLQTA